MDRSSRGCHEHAESDDDRSEPAGAMGSFASDHASDFDQTAAPSQSDLCNRPLPHSRFVRQEARSSSSRFMRNDYSPPLVRSGLPGHADQHQFIREIPWNSPTPWQAAPSQIYSRACQRVVNHRFTTQPVNSASSQTADRKTACTRKTSNITAP